MSVKRVGQTTAGAPVDQIVLAGGGLTARVLSWGAVIQDLRLEGHEPPLVLGFESFEPYPTQSPHFGAIAGRCANRIEGGAFEIDGIAYQTPLNEDAKHTLHGGPAGFGVAAWAIEEASAAHAVLHLHSPNGDMGFPGALDVWCRYELIEPGRLVITLTAETDAPTLCNLAHHSYFNLDDGGARSALDHRLQIEAESYLPTTPDLIPTGVAAQVAGTQFDFRAMRRIAPGGYDTNFCIGSERGALRRVATAVGARSGVAMEVWTTEPGVQFYDGARVARSHPGLEGVQYGAHAGFCLEPQIWPNAINTPGFPTVVLRPGETYRQVTEYRFRG